MLISFLYAFSILEPIYKKPTYRKEEYVKYLYYYSKNP